jgi:hypothetical protein
MMSNDNFRWNCVEGTREIKRRIEKEMAGLSVVEYLAKQRKLRELNISPCRLNTLK